MSRETIINVPKNNSSENVWITWYDALKNKFGRKKANSLFTANWDAQSGSGSDANTTTLRQHLKKEGKLDLKGSFAGEIKDKVFDVGNFLGDYITVGKYLGIGLGVVVLGGLGLFVYNLAKDPDKAVRIGTAVATRGMSEAVPKK